MKIKLFLPVTLLLFCFPQAYAQKNEIRTPKLPVQIACPISGKIVNLTEATKSGHFADYEYKRYYFCCDNCPKAFAKEPEKFTGKAAVRLTDIPLPLAVKCPIMGSGTIVKKATADGMFADYEGRRYYFCCKGCPETFAKDPSKFVKKESVPIGQLPLPKRGKCAKTGEDIDTQDALNSKRFADYKGRRYLFCCDNCMKEFKANPARFADKPGLPSPIASKPIESKTE